MSVYFSESFLIRLRDEVRKAPLQTDEICRVVGVGEHYTDPRIIRELTEPPDLDSTTPCNL